jgi:hypothetical protein
MSNDIVSRHRLTPRLRGSVLARLIAVERGPAQDVLITEFLRISLALKMSLTR